jgi:magnesium-transporting ATPase (P-type)
MILDKYISFRKKVIFSVVCSGIWIYFRTQDCYNLIPSHNIFPIVFVMIWTYLNYYEPLFLPIGLLVLVVYSKIYTKKRVAIKKSLTLNKY